MRPMLLMLACVSFLAVGCSKDVVRPNERLPVDSNVLIGLSERLPERSLVLACRTSREYGCFNYIIDTRLFQLPQSIRIDFNQVVAPVICATAVGPARVELDLGALGPGSASLDLRGGTGGLTGRLDVSEGSYRVLVPQGGFRFDHRTLQRIPSRTVWGFFGYPRTDLEPAARAVIGQMLALGATPRRLAEGRYSVVLPNQNRDTFKADASGTIQYDGGHGYYHILPFALSFDGDLAALREVVARTGRDFGDDLQLRVYTWQGDALYSWVLGRGQ